MRLDINPYDILGVSNDASTEDVKAAYRRIARRLHPDVNPENAAAAAQFQDIANAYEILSDASRRRTYDENRAKATREQHYFTLRATPSKRTIAILPEPQVIYLLAEIFPDPEASKSESKKESRLNLTLVLDQSNSMTGTRLEKVKVAAHQIIDNMESEDILSVIVFNDRAETVIPATPVKDKPALKARISMINASGGTEIYQGLSAGFTESKKFLGPRMVNHIILLTDGHTFGDQQQCLELAEEAAREGVSISAMGLGHDWNDKFLDDIASKTGGNSSYVSSAGAVVKFLNEHVRNLSNAFAERVRISIAPDPDIQLELAFKLAPHPQPLNINDGIIPLGSLQVSRPISLLLQFQIPDKLSEGFRYIARMVVSGDIMANQEQSFQAISDLALEIKQETSEEDPPPAILEALSKLTLYRLQERAQEALENGDITDATRRLENLATRLLAMGEEDLANQALSEARRVAHTSDLSDKGRKALKYQTRFLLASPINEDDEQ